MCRVLVVDDDPSVVALCVFALEFEGHQAVGFTDLPQALDAARREHFDVLVADVPTAGDAVLATEGETTALPMLLIAEDSLQLLHILTTVVRTDVYGLAKPFDIGEFVDEVQRLAHARAA
jgi:DNA-binding NtrC family response regulator